jgi:hypothetical protein
VSYRYVILYFVSFVKRKRFDWFLRIPFFISVIESISRKRFLNDRDDSAASCNAATSALLDPLDHVDDDDDSP